MTKRKKNVVKMKTKNQMDNELKQQIEKRAQVKAIYKMMKELAAKMIQSKGLEESNKEVYDVFKTINDYEVANVDQMSALEIAQVEALYIKSYMVLTNAAANNTPKEGEENVSENN